MTSRDFCFWLQGWFELNNPKSASGEVLEVVKNHLNLVFVHDIDPSMGGKEHQIKLNEVHSGSPYNDLAKRMEMEKPSNWNENWKYSSLLHEWYDPKEGVPRC